LASTAQLIVLVISEQQPPHTQAVIDFYKARMRFNRNSTFDVENDPWLPDTFSGVDVLYRIDKPISFRMATNPMAKDRQHQNSSLPWRLAKMNVQGKYVCSCRPTSLQLRPQFVGAQSQGHTGVIVPNYTPCQ
jgi:hypothetical protein